MFRFFFPRRLASLFLLATFWGHGVATENPDSETTYVSLQGQKAEGYRSIWYKIGRSRFGPKYGGALGTYSGKHRPLAHYSKDANKTFFVWGGTRNDKADHLLIMASYYDHETGMVPKPTIVRDGLGNNRSRQPINFT